MTNAANVEIVSEVENTSAGFDFFKACVEVPVLVALPAIMSLAFTFSK